MENGVLLRKHLQEELRQARMQYGSDSPKAIYLREELTVLNLQEALGIEPVASQAPTAARAPAGCSAVE